MDKEKIKEIADAIYDIPNAYDTYWRSHCERLAEDLYNAGYRKQEWVSVKDKLPEKEEIVLCCLGLVQNVYTYKGDNIWEDSYGYYQKDEPITHWMPLLEPPKGE